MVEVFKLTDGDMRTYNDTQWELGATRRLLHRKNPRLCTGDVFHVYTSLATAVFMYKIHVEFTHPLIFRATTSEIVALGSDGVRGCFDLTLVKKLSIPDWVLDPRKFYRARIQFVLACSQAVLPIFEKVRPYDPIPRRAVLAIEGVLNGKPMEIAMPIEVAKSTKEAFRFAHSYVPFSPEANAALAAADTARAICLATEVADGMSMNKARDVATVAAYVARVTQIMGIEFNIDQIAEQSVNLSLK